MADIIRVEYLIRAQELHDQGRIADAYAVLADAGDIYAANAYQITNNDNTGIFDFLVPNIWDYGAPGAREDMFMQVAATHQQNYLNAILDGQFTTADGHTFYELPDTYEIELSYYNSLISNDLPPEVAIDLLINTAFNGYVSWSGLLQIEDSRQSSQSLSLEGISGGEAFERLFVAQVVGLLESGEIAYDTVVDALRNIGRDTNAERLLNEAIGSAKNNCFLGDTAISMWPLDPNLEPGPDGIYNQDEVRAKIWTKPIRDIRVKDIIVAHDKNGNLVPDVVSRTFQNKATHILDFWGTGVTPGHAYLCGDGKHEGEYAPLIDILRQDGAIVLENGTKVRAAINWPVGSLPDQFIWVLAGHDDGQNIQVTNKKQIRIGTRMIAPDGSDDCILDRLVHTYGPLSEGGFFENGTDVRSLVLHWPYGDKIPNPEDYILQRSDLTLEEIYTANEWEQIGTRMPPPSTMVGFNPRVANSHAALMLQASKPVPNIPPAFADHPDVPSGATKLNRKQRKAMEARKRKTARVKMRKLH